MGGAQAPRPPLAMLPLEKQLIYNFEPLLCFDSNSATKYFFENQEYVVTFRNFNSNWQNF